MILIPILLIILATVPLAAQPSEADFILLQKDYILNADGSSELHCRQIIKYNTHISFNSLYGETFIVYNPQYQQLKINESYCIQADKNKITAPTNAFNEVLPRFAADAPAYNHLREMVVTHTGLEIGATSYLDYTLHTKAGYVPELDKCINLQESSPIKEYKITVSVPSNKKLAYRAHLSKENPSLTQQDGRTRYEWTFRNIPASSKELYQPADGSNSPHLIFSTWGSQNVALAWLAQQMRYGDLSQLSARIGALAKNVQNDPHTTGAQVYDFVVNGLATTPVPIEYSGYKLRNVAQILSSAYGTPAEKASLFLAVAKVMGVPATPVAVYPSYIDGSVGSIDAITGFAVAIINEGFCHVLSPTETTALSLTVSRPGFRYIEINQDAFMLNHAFDNTADLNVQIEAGRTSAKTEALLKITGAFEPLLPVWLNENTVKGLLSSGDIAGFENLSVSPAAVLVNLDGKLNIKENNGYYSFILPEIRGGVNSWNMRNLTSDRRSVLEIPYMVNELYVYNIRIPQGMQAINTASPIVRENKLGRASVTIEKQGTDLMKIVRSLQITSGTINPADYTDLAELIKLWESENYRIVVYK